MILAVAGRRIDAPDAETSRFPLKAIDDVHEKVHALLRDRRVTAVVSSAACGADLMALEAARALGCRCRIVLPFDSKRFRDTSVTDRPGDWGERYDRVIEAVRAADDLIVLGCDPEDSAAYVAANEAILDEAVTLGRRGGEPVSALLIWDGAARGPDDVTQQFGASARARGLTVDEVLTIDPAERHAGRKEEP